MAGTLIQLIDTGYFYADGGSMFGTIPRTAWSRRYPYDDQNRCILAMRVGLVITNCGRVILIDTGVGNKQLDKLKSSSYQFFNLVNLCDALEKYGIKPEQVTDVVLTHLHFDHCGGISKIKNEQITPTFPYATCWVSSVQWENSQHPIPLETDSFFPENINIIKTEGNLQLIQSDCELCKGVQLRLYDGHTPGQIVPYIQTSGSTVVFAGDVIPVSAQISPTWISAYDLYPATSYNEKIRLLNEAASDSQTIVHYHDANSPCSTVKKINNFFKIDHKVVL